MHEDRLGALQFEGGKVYGSRGGYGLRISTRDFARIGWFWLNRGKWGDRQLLPEEYFETYIQPGVRASISRSSEQADDYLNVGSFGGGSAQTSHGPGVYGFSFWFNPDSKSWTDVPADAYQANGDWNRCTVAVIPSLSLVAAWRGKKASTSDFPRVMNNQLKVLMEAVVP